MNLFHETLVAQLKPIRPFPGTEQSTEIFRTLASGERDGFAKVFKNLRAKGTFFAMVTTDCTAHHLFTPVAKTAYRCDAAMGVLSRIGGTRTNEYLLHDG
ncbi:MAG: hypothetical protein KDI47_12080 [Gammaproteobacteria bacterium]|nr:hypothetical protein [Gammaproteobacteria bacterium]MCB1872783.1 hypothetical protein [Gammaproteobacteria bacterium]MCB1880030.1 hypothetical protein [Gammaproteobacteria bacterium]MCB1905075.1 hypothetical protein [Gammaproteobacteria bacterium]